MSKPQVVSFYHPDGLVPTWKLAQKFADEGGKIATLPDIIEIRLNSNPNNPSWNNWFTTSTAEYFGIGKDDRKKIIVAHGIGPMSTLDGIIKAYSHEFKDKTRNNRGGRISQEEFLGLESGQYGPVYILDFDDIVINFAFWRVQYPFAESLNYKQCYFNNLLRARLGPKSDEFINLHTKIAMNDDSKIIRLKDASNCSYLFRPLEKGLAVAHLISISQLQSVIQGKEFGLITEISCHEWSNGNKFVGIRKNAKLNTIDKYADSDYLLKQNWQHLMAPAEHPIYPGSITRIINYDGQDFTEYPKKGNRMDTGEPEFLVLSKEPIGEPIDFQTPTGGTDWFFRYDIKEVSILAPPESNSYAFAKSINIICIKNEPKFHATKIQFYRAKIDYSHRLIQANQLANDYDKMIELIDE